jgi:hypothetical protein
MAYSKANGPLLECVLVFPMVGGLLRCIHRCVRSDTLYKCYNLIVAVDEAWMFVMLKVCSVTCRG